MMLSHIIEEAQDAFWAVIAKKYPTATTGDLSPDSVFRFREACNDVVRAWLDSNLPEGTRINTRDGRIFIMGQDGMLTGENQVANTPIQNLTEDFEVLV